MFAIENNSLTRELSIKLAIEVSISYEQFINHDEYKSLFQKKARREILSWLTMRWIRSSRDFRSLKPYELVFGKLLDVSINETFHNVDKLFSSMSEQANILYKVKQWEALTREETNTLNFRLTDKKYFITKNKYFYGLYKWYIREKAKLVTPHRKDAIISNMQELTKKETKELKKLVQFEQEEIQHQLPEYLLFLTLTTNLELYLIINPVLHEYIITTWDKISTHMWAYWMIYCISKIIRWMITYSSIEFLDEIRSKYSFENNSNTDFVKDLLEIVRKSPSSKIQVNASKWYVTDISFSNRDQDLGKYEEMKQYRRWEQWVTRTTGIEEYWPQKKAIITTWKIRYWKKK